MRFRTQTVRGPMIPHPPAAPRAMANVAPVPRTAAAPRDFFSTFDFTMFLPVLLLVGIGVVMVYSASSALALKKFGSDTYFLQKQAIYAVMGVLLLLAAYRTPIRTLRHLTYPLVALTFVMLFAVHIPAFGFSAGGATRWLNIGGISFQPAEFARFVLVLYLAYSLSRKQEQLDDFYIGFLPHLIVLGIFSFLIVLQPDFGSVVILGALTWIMMFMGGVPIKHLGLSLLVLFPAAYVFLVVESYRIERIISFFDPWQYAADGGYQIIHSLMAFGSGGIWGKGLGQGYQKLFYLPEPHTDFIFSVIGEELGLMGVLFILVLYGVIVYKGIRIALDAPDMFASLLAGGITFALALQVCVNTGVALALLPTKGLTLPFLSYGGTSLVLNLIAVGVLMKIGVAETE
jgi:cell division protein FtsW